MTNTESNVADQAFAEMFTAKLKASEPVTTPAPEPETAPVVEAPDPNAPAPETPSPDAPAEPESEDAPPEDVEETEEEEEAEEPPKTPEPEASEAAHALAANGAKLTLDDVPEAARPFVQQRIKEIEAGLTRARQKDTETLVALKAEQRFQTERPADYIVAAIRKDPKLADAINAKLEELGDSPTAAEAHDVVVERAREKARAAEETAAGTAEAQAREAAELDVRLSARLDAARVKSGPALERLIAQQLDLNEKLTGRRHITAEQVDEIADAHIATVEAAREHGRKLEKRRLSERRVQDKLTDRATAGLVVRPGAGSAPTPAPASKPTNDAEFKAYLVGKLKAQSHAAAS